MSLVFPRYIPIYTYTLDTNYYIQVVRICADYLIASLVNTTILRTLLNDIPIYIHVF